MDLKKLLELLGVDSLDEDKQNEIKDSLKTIIETRANEEADELLKKEKAEHIGVTAGGIIDDDTASRIREAGLMAFFPKGTTFD